MKFYALLALVLALCMLFIPALAVEREQPPQEVPQGETIAVMATATGRVTQVEMREYVKGVVAAEISPLSHPEAIKAQAVAAYTYALYVRNRNNGVADPTLKGADITDSPSVYQGYRNEENRREEWGEHFAEYEQKITEAVDEVYGWVITYNDLPILAAYFDSCHGKTQSAKNRWGTEIPYLQGVQSPGDRLSPTLTHTLTLSLAEFKEYAKGLGDVHFGKDTEEWAGEPVLNKDGYVQSIQIGGLECTGAQVRSVFRLSSDCFTLALSKTGAVLESKGSGHCVGMSQYGADYMARQGSTWEEILQHYYTNVEILCP